ncbi:tetratricopeptide repeat protein [Candidatus Poribacteria bacterium]
MALRLPTIVIIVLMSLAALSSWAQNDEQQNPLQQAADFYLDNVRRAPNDLELHRELMDMFREKRFTTVPIAIYRNSLEQNANNSMLLYLLGYAYLMAYGQPMAEGEPDPLRMAEENLKAALQIKSNFPDAVSAMGDLYLRKDQSDLAIEKWEEAIKLNSRFEAAHLSMARFYRSQKEYDKAIDNYQRAISLKPKRVAIRYLELGLTYMDMEDLDRAESAFEKAKKYDSKMAMAYYKLGQVYAKRGERDKAVKIYRTGRKHDPDNAEVAYELAHIFLGTNDTKYALLSMERGLSADAVDPEMAKELANRIEKGTVAAADFMSQLADFEYSRNLQLHYFLGKLYLKIGENEDRALKHFKLAAGLDEANADVHYQLGLLQEKLEPEKAKEQYQKAVELGASDIGVSAEAQADLLFKAAQGYLDEGLEAKFIETAQQGLAIYSNRPDIHLQLAKIFNKRAQIYKNSGQKEQEDEMLQKAVEHYEQVTILQPDAQRWYNLGLLYEWQKKIKAIRAYDKAVQLDPNFARAYYRRGYFRLHYKIGDAGVLMYQPPVAVEDFKKAIELDPKLADAHFSLGTAYHQMDMPEEATAEFAKTVELDPDNVQAHVYLAQDYAAAGENEKVIQHLTKAAELEDSNAEILKTLGAMQLQYGGDSGIKAAQKALEKAVELKPDDAEISMNYGYTLYLDRLFNEAIEKLKKAIEIQSNYPEAHYNLALSYKAVRKYDLARQHWEKVIKLVPGTPLADKAAEFVDTMNQSETP